MRDLGEVIAYTAMGLFVAGFLVLMGLFIAEEVMHPCVRYQKKQSTCGGILYCSIFDSNGLCMIWNETPEYPCQINVCVERKP